MDFNFIMTPRNKHILVFVLTAFLACGSTVPAYSQSSSTPNDPPEFAQMIVKLIKDTAQAIKKSMPNLERFKIEIAKYKKKIEAYLPNFLAGLTVSLEKYAAHQGSLSQSSDSLFSQVGRQTDKAWKKISKIPQMKALAAIVGPIMGDFTREIRASLPKPRTHNPNNNPLGVTRNFYDDMAEDNPHGLGPFFKIPKLASGTRTGAQRESSRDNTTGGVLSTDVRFRETEERENRELEYYELIVNNKVKRYYLKPQDLSLLHGLPQEMRKNGESEEVVRFAEEYTHLSNYHLQHQHRRNGLIIDPNHRQLKNPPGYTPQTFAERFTALLENWGK